MGIAYQNRLPAGIAGDLVRQGVERLGAGDRHNAREMFLGALSADIGCGGAWQGLGSVALGPNRYAASIAIGRRALALTPDDFRLKVNLGNALWRAQRFSEAETLLLEALAIAPNDAPCHQNIGLLYYSTARADLAERHFRRGLELCADSDTLALRGDHAHAVLKTGDLARGLELLECRWEGLITKNPIWECGLPKWQGETVDGELLLHHEQGHGDTLQFCRFIPAIKQRSGASQIVFAAPKALHRLLEGQCGIDEIVDDQAPGAIVRAASRADYHCPLMSAVAVLRPDYASMPKPAPYLRAPASVERLLHAGDARLAIGLVWAASTSIQERGRQRSVPVEDLLCLGEIPGVRLWSLQVGQFASDIGPTAADCLIGDAPPWISDFADTAAFMSKLDLIVSVDTAAAHLAGALGRPIFMLNPINPCWRWVRGAGAWYSSMTIFDQVDPTNWTHPLNAIKARVERLVAERREVAEAA